MFFFCWFRVYIELLHVQRSIVVYSSRPAMNELNVRGKKINLIIFPLYDYQKLNTHTMGEEKKLSS